MPLRQFDGHVFGAVDKNKLAVVKIHHVVADLDAGGGELGDLGFQVVDGETDVIEPDLVELGDVGVGDHLRLTIGQKMHLDVRVLDAHVVFHDLAGDHDGFYFPEAQQREEALGGGDIAHDNGDVIEVADHGVPLFRR